MGYGCCAKDQEVLHSFRGQADGSHSERSSGVEYETVKFFRAKLEIADTKTVFAEATFDTFWERGEMLLALKVPTRQSGPGVTS